MSIHLADANPSLGRIKTKGKPRGSMKNIMVILRALGLKDVFWSDSFSEDDYNFKGPGGKIRLVTSKWDDRPAKRR
jgi:hypothetical protein